MTPKPNPPDPDVWKFGPGTNWDMTSTLTFRELAGDTFWGVNGVATSESDRWWGEMLTYARAIYGDDGIVIDSGSLPSSSRYDHRGRFLRYADGDHLPYDGRVAFSSKDAAGKTARYVQNADGTVNKIDHMGQSTGDAIRPDRYTFSPDDERIVAWYGGRKIFSAPTTDFKLPDGATQFHQMSDNTLVPVPKGTSGQLGIPAIPGIELLTILPNFPEWFRRRHSDAYSAYLSLFVLLRASLGKGDPAAADKSPIKFQVSTDNAGIPTYGTLKESFSKLAQGYNSIIDQMVSAVKNSADLTRRARGEVNTGISKFNQAASTIVPPKDDEPDDAECGQVHNYAATAIASIVQAINVVVNTPHETGRFDEVARIPGAPVLAIPQQTEAWPKPMGDVDWKSDPSVQGGAIVAGAPGLAGVGLDELARRFGGDPTKLVGSGPAARMLAKPLPVVGNVMSVVFGTAADTKSQGFGKALATNTAGTAISAVAGNVLAEAGVAMVTRAAGAAIGQTLVPIPGVGAAVGVVVGTAIAPYATKLLQSLF